MRRSASEPIKYPPPATFDQRIRRNIYQVLYQIFHAPKQVNIDKMSYQEFVAWCERAIAEDA